MSAQIPDPQDAATRRKNLRLLLVLAIVVLGCASLAYTCRESMMPAFYDS